MELKLIADPPLVQFKNWSEGNVVEITSPNEQVYIMLD